MPLRKLPLLACFLSLAIAGVSGAVPKGDDWPQWRGPRRDGVWRETGLIDKFAGPDVPVKWRVPVANGYSGPTVADGRVFVSDRLTDPASQERVHCFDAETGKSLWSFAYGADYKAVSYPNGPRSSVTVSDARAYFLGTVGHLHCFEASTGKVLWAKDLAADYQIRLPDWGIAGAPLIEGELLIVPISGAGHACLVALDRKTGSERWKALPDRATYSSPVVIEQAGQRVLVYWTADRLVGLEPATGKLLWEVANPSLMNVDGVGTPVLESGLLFVTSVYEGSLMVRLKPDAASAEKAWAFRSPGGGAILGLHSLISNPILRDGHIYGINYFGELRCLEAATGKQVWEEKSVVPKAMWAAAHMVQNGDLTWILNERGQLIIARLAPKGYEELSRAQLIKPTKGQLGQRGGVAWSHPAYAYGHVFARNDEELICADLRKPVK